MSQEFASFSDSVLSTDLVLFDVKMFLAIMRAKILFVALRGNLSLWKCFTICSQEKLI